MDQIDTFIVSDPEQSLIYQENFVNFPESFTVQDKITIQDEAKNVISTMVRWFKVH